MSCCTAGAAANGDAAATDGLVGLIEEQKLLAASHDLGNGKVQTDFIVPSMHCIACIKSIETRLGEIPFVENVRVNLSLKRVSVAWSQGKSEGGTGRAVIIDEALTALGFPHAPYDLETAMQEDKSASRRLLLSLAVAGFAAANIMLLSVSVWSGADEATAQLFHLISGLIAAPAIFFAGQPFFSSAASAIKAGRLNMDVPISLGVLMAFAMSLHESLTGGEEAYFDASVMLLFFLLIGRYLDHLMRDRARNAVVRLSRLSARGGSQVHQDGSLSFVRASDIEPGMVLRVAAGERMPVDAVVISGTSDADRSLVTGESAPVALQPGDQVEAGILNLTGALDIQAQSTTENSFLAEVMAMMETAEQGRGRYVRVADRAAKIYAPAIHLLALATFLGWMIHTGGDWHTSIYTAIALMIITCPCALALAVPVVHVIGAGRLFNNGILMKEGSALERLAEADHAVFDKTGTLTTGTPCVASASGLSAADMPAALALAMHSTHPVSRAIAAFLPANGNPDPADLDGIREVAGFGMEALLGGRTVRLGRRHWVGEIASAQGTDIPDDGPAFAVEGGSVATFVIRETLRDDARDVFATLREAGMAPEILSGDREGAVAAIAAELRADRHSANLTPKGKIERLEELADQGWRTLMVGDGINDAPALAAGHVSMAPASASDVGRLAADFVFTRESLSAVVFAREIARRAARLVRQNFALTIAYNGIAVPLAISGHVTPLIAAVAMSASSIVVVANSMRLNLKGSSERREIARTARPTRVAGPVQVQS